MKGRIWLIILGAVLLGGVAWAASAHKNVAIVANGNAASVTHPFPVVFQ